MSAEAWGAVLGLLVYGGMKAIDRVFRVLDHVLDERLHDDDHQEDDDVDG